MVVDVRVSSTPPKITVQTVDRKDRCTRGAASALWIGEIIDHEDFSADLAAIGSDASDCLDCKFAEFAYFPYFAKRS